ncbi:MULTISPECIES: FAD-binding domain-containing protein [Prochlorococcus]|uniref:Deoxyribodipyrimidine photolyase n=1 Tax=Prochlorococcus marinus str. MIT 9116 TaxID=167544 RepID=A0A0A1ZNP8_PROMR|nr:FAD-binding domain-containing protein [Prochlorococcus marinus]KGF89122.1 Deoxyribodipyrimidine photolyase [Prochlorococcus marinus str. MIT 9107]KGF89879.1 Deoxyribodipyrimidine photolyase [Prochlorococcus marinus str. MIT 9116]KGF95209.1 Deoxyribodipyrimidine photolyase [Prochlorococcus marinus str. MIT 9123]
MNNPRILFWHRKDLRIIDNQALKKAFSLSNAITSTYILDKNYSFDFNANSRAWFLGKTLQELGNNWKKMGSRLLIGEGDPVLIIPELAKTIDAKFVAWNKSIEPYEINRDLQIKKILKEIKIQVIESWDHLLIEPSKIFSGNNKPYSVYGPFYKNLKSKMNLLGSYEQDKQNLIFKDMDNKFQENQKIKSSDLVLEKFLKNIKFSGAKICPCRPGEKGAETLLREFINKKKIFSYNSARDFPSYNGTSFLSASLRFGTISIRKVWNATLNLNSSFESHKNYLSIETWQKELVWREFYQHCLFHFPELERGPYRKKWDQFPWQNNNEWFQLWSNGETGVPIVDAAMRQLNSTGWMHNRCRMIVASFLVKDLICNWQMGEKKFMDILVDGDLAANNGGWQWSASSGMDPKPLRIFNPYTQASKFDPICEYIKAWIPELSKLSNSDLLNGEISNLEKNNYARPIVNHNMQQRLFKSLYAEI